MDKEATALHIPEQMIPVPTSISPQGQAWLAAAAPQATARWRPGWSVPEQSDSVGPWR